MNIGLILERETGRMPAHAAFSRRDLKEATTLKEILSVRKVYARESNPGCSLLAGAHIDAVSVELIYLNKALGLGVAALDEMAAVIDATKYPDNDDLIELVTELTIAGY